MLKKNCRGFTLIEIMIVVGIVTLMAGLGIPQLLRTRLNTNEKAAIGSMHALSYGLEGFRAANFAIGYPVSLVNLAPPGQPTYVNQTLALANPTKNGYNFFYTQVPGAPGGPSTQYHIYAEPVTLNVTGIRGFYVDEQGIICEIPQAAGDPGHAPLGSAGPAGYNIVQ